MEKFSYGVRIFLHKEYYKILKYLDECGYTHMGGRKLLDNPTSFKYEINLEINRNDKTVITSIYSQRGDIFIGNTLKGVMGRIKVSKSPVNINKDTELKLWVKDKKTNIEIELIASPHNLENAKNLIDTLKKGYSIIKAWDGNDDDGSVIYQIDIDSLNKKNIEFLYLGDD